ncbi:unnamed protein product [Rangifer tarandus platyrhynchus]|uniref:Uncharacterized protein n=2 Tax=Rangifer tarandus platyrhynchus TaxID=3082113 RepID=A0ACB0F5Q2_RANTA|nr:unnamed protein product [Rangifer tarandus platyrhynchus]CAI9707436.1 unnamed protein product [Rangifer tarandus platyrhynchus]
MRVMSLSAAQQSLYSSPLGFNSQGSGFPPPRRRIYLVHKQTASHPSYPHQAHQRKVPSTRATERLILRSWSKKQKNKTERGGRDRGALCAPPAQRPGQRASLPARPETRSGYWRTGQGQPGRGVGAGRGQPPRAPRATTSSPPSGCGRGPKKLEKEPGEGGKRSSISSSSTPPKHRSGGDPGRPPDSGALAHPRLPRAPPRASPNPPERGCLTPAAGSERCRDTPEANREAGERCSPATTVSRGGNPGVSPRPRGGCGSSRLYSGSTSSARPVPPQSLSINPPWTPGAPRISDPAVPSTSLARWPLSPAPSLETRSPRRPAPRFL